MFDEVCQDVSPTSTCRPKHQFTSCLNHFCFQGFIATVCNLRAVQAFFIVMKKKKNFFLHLCNPMSVYDIAQQVTSAKQTADPHTEELSFQGNKRNRHNILNWIEKQSDTWLYRQEELPEEDRNSKGKKKKLERKRNYRYYLRE